MPDIDTIQIRTAFYAIEILPTHLAYDEMFIDGSVEAVKERSPQLYAAKFKEKFGKFPSGFIPDQAAQSTLNRLFSTQERNALNQMSMSDLRAAGQVKRLKALDPHLYSMKFVEAYGKLPKD